MQSDSFSEVGRSKAAECFPIVFGWVGAFFRAMEYAWSRLGDLILGVRVGVLLREYAAAGCPDRYLKERPTGTRAAELRNLSLLKPFWSRIRVRRISLARCYQYFRWRVPQLTRGKGGGRTVELELNTLRNALRHGEQSGSVKSVPKFEWPGFCPEESVRHCRECMPTDATEVHALAERFFLARPSSHVLGFLALFLADTGLRPHEGVALRVDAGPEEPGYVTPDGKLLRVLRGKRQAKVNPWVPITEELAELLKALHRWRRKYYPDSPWYFPSPRDPRKPVGVNSLTRALNRITGNGDEGDSTLPSH